MNGMSQHGRGSSDGNGSGFDSGCHSGSGSGGEHRGGPGIGPGAGQGQGHAGVRGARAAVLAPVVAVALVGGALVLAAQPAGATASQREASAKSASQHQQKAAHAPRTRTAAPRLGECATGALCFWERGQFRGERRTYELSAVDIESCVPLPAGSTAASLANRTGRPVTVYQSRECAETGEFVTHPSGTWTPEAAYRGRAFKIWER